MFFVVIYRQFHMNKFSNRLYINGGIIPFSYRFKCTNCVLKDNFHFLCFPMQFYVLYTFSQKNKKKTTATIHFGLD